MDGVRFRPAAVRCSGAQRLRRCTPRCASEARPTPPSRGPQRRASRVVSAPPRAETTLPKRKESARRDGQQPGGAAPAADVVDSGVRVNKAFRAFASRREADRFVEEGRVTVNGMRAQSGQLLRPGDDVRLDGVSVQWEALQVDLAAASPQQQHTRRLPLEESFLYVKYHKPRGVTCTMDEATPGSLAKVLAPQLPVRVFSVGRLDKDSTGLLLLTSDGRVPNAVLRSANGHEKVYRVRTGARVSDADVRQLAAGVVITTVAQRDGNRAAPLTAPTKPCAVERGGPANWLQFTLKEGRNRQIRKMLGALGYDVLILHRVRFLGIELGALRPGEWAELTEREMKDIRSAVRGADQSWQQARGRAGNPDATEQSAAE